MARSEREQGRVKPQGIAINEVVRLKDYVGVGGRPLLEFRADPDVIAEQRAKGVIFTVEPHNLTDNRSRYPRLKTNRPAMQEAEREATSVQHDLAWINESYFSGDTPLPTTGHVRNMIEIGLWLPPYLVHRAENPINRHNIPDHVANLYKVSQGLLIAADSIVQERGAQSIITPRDMYDAGNAPRHPDGRPFLVGRQVCPADQMTIEATVAGLLYRTDGDAHQSELNRLVGPEEFPSLKDFSHLMQSFLHFNLVHSHNRDLLVRKGQDLIRAGTPTDDPQILEIAEQVSDIVELVTQKKALAQTYMNIALGRNPHTAPPVS